MGNVVAISGGNLESTKPLNRYLVSMSKKDHPNFLFLPTASEDAMEYIQNVHKHFEPLGCNVGELCLTKETYSTKTIQHLFQTADIIYVGGGDTIKMMRLWNEHGVDTLLLEAYYKNKIMAGISAGAICWFEYGHSDSEAFTGNEHWNYTWAKGLGIFNGAFCPHYNEMDRKCFDKMLKDINIDGYALDNNVAFVETNGTYKIFKCSTKGNAYYLKYKKDTLVKKELIANSLP